MSLLTTQRVISNGLAQLRFEEVWPSIKNLAPEESVIKGLSSPKLLELRQLIRQVVLEQGRKVVIFSQWRRMLALAQWSVRRPADLPGVAVGLFHRPQRGKSGGPRISSSFTKTRPFASSSPAMPAA